MANQLVIAQNGSLAGGMCKSYIGRSNGRTTALQQLQQNNSHELQKQTVYSDQQKSPSELRQNNE